MMMGIFDKFKESAEVGKNAKWRIGAAPTVVILNDDYMNLKMGGKEIRIFYKDIQQIEQALYNIEIKTSDESIFKYIFTNKFRTTYIIYYLIGQIAYYTALGLKNVNTN